MPPASGVIATNATVRSHIYRTELHKICPELAVREIAAPQLVPAIEGNDFAAAERLAKNMPRSLTLLTA